MFNAIILNSQFINITFQWNILAACFKTNLSNCLFCLFIGGWNVNMCSVIWNWDMAVNKVKVVILLQVPTFFFYSWPKFELKYSVIIYMIYIIWLPKSRFNPNETGLFCVFCNRGGGQFHNSGSIRILRHWRWHIAVHILRKTDKRNRSVTTRSLWLSLRGSSQGLDWSWNAVHELTSFNTSATIKHNMPVCC